MVNIFELVDIAPTGVANQSSVSPLSRPDGAQALVQDHPGVTFASATNLESNPWWQLDLGTIRHLYRIVIENRTEPQFWDRTSRLQVEVSQDGHDWELIHSGRCFFGGGTYGSPMQLELSGRIDGRFIRLSLPETTVLHLLRVRVFVTRRDVILETFLRENGLPVINHHPYYIDLAKHIGVDPYRIVQIGNHNNGRIIGFIIRKFGRFGNNIVQIINAIHLARGAGVGHVIVQDIGIPMAQEPFTIDGITLIPIGTDPPPGLYLYGDFYYTPALGEDVQASLSRDVLYSITQTFVLPLVAMNFRDPQEQSSPRDLIVHIRSGDIFVGKPHPDYIQPPLNFYVQVVETLLSRDQIDGVVIVSEDDLNPCVRGLDAYLQSRNIPYRRQSGDLREDLARIIGAKHMIFGRGTFGYAVCLLSGAIETLHVFDTDMYDDFANIRELTVIEPTEPYIGPGQWQATPDQCQLMLDFPPSALAVRPQPTSPSWSKKGVELMLDKDSL